MERSIIHSGDTPLAIQQTLKTRNRKKYEKIFSLKVHFRQTRQAKHLNIILTTEQNLRRGNKADNL